jgi:hypothetical protein
MRENNRDGSIAIAKEIGFTNISLSSQLLSMIRMVARGVSTTADAYLTPVLQEYLDGFYSGFEGGREGNLNVEPLATILIIESNCEESEMLVNPISLASFPIASSCSG